MIFTPRPHDKLSIHHLLTHKEAALFAGMGLGKTANTLTAFDGLRIIGDAKAALVIAPLRVACLTWPNEIAKWDHLKHLRTADLRRKEGYKTLERGGADLYLINYEQLQKFADLYLRRRSGPCAFDTVVYDELTAAKNPGSKRINAVRKHFTPEHGVHRRWGLTGTPTPNGLSELYGQIRVLDHGQRFGPSFGAWQSAYFEKLDYMGYKWGPRPGAKAKIYSKIEDMVLSLPQQDHSNVPLPIEEDIDVHLPDEAREAYDELERKLVIMLKDETELVAVNAAALVMKLVQITGGAVYREDKSVAHIHDAKIHAAQKYVGALEGKPVIVVCNFKHERERLLRALHGATSFENSKEFLHRWNSNKIKTLVVDPRELSHGLNMQEGGANHVLWFSQTYSREQYDQLNGRLCRSGQRNQVHVARLICPGTINDAVVEALRQRGEGQRALMDTLQNFKRLAT